MSFLSLGRRPWNVDLRGGSDLSQNETFMSRKSTNALLGSEFQKYEMREDEERNNHQGSKQRDSALLLREARDKNLI